jgi:hypothetical protein
MFTFVQDDQYTPGLGTLVSGGVATSPGHLLVSSCVKPDTLESLQAPSLTPYKTKLEVYEFLNQVTEEVVLTHIAGGLIPPMLAAHYALPVHHFKSWVHDVCSPDKVKEAITACADVLMAKATAALTMTFDKPSEFFQQKAYADQLKEMAERLNPETWAPPRKYEPPPPAVNIVIKGPDMKPSDSGVRDRSGDTLVHTSIPGLEALRFGN